MPTERLSMRHIREVLRLHHSVGMSQRSVARSLGVAQGTVSKYLNRTRRAGLTWPLPPELDDDVRLENRLYPPPSDLPSDDRPQPDWAVVHRELRRPSVTLMLLWEEYCDHAHVDVLLQQVGGEAVPQSMQRDALVDRGQIGGSMTGAIELARRHQLHPVAAREQPTLRSCRLPPGAQQIKQIRREHHVAVLAALALLDDSASAN